MSNVTNETLATLLDISSRRRKVLTNNVANLNTPGYRTGRLEFEDVLSEALGEEGDSGAIETDVERPHFGNADASGNNVRLGREIVELNKNSLRTECYLAFLKFRKRLKMAAIRGR